MSGLRLGHRARRFARSLRPGPPRAADEAWAVGLLSEREVPLYRRMSNPDRRHAVAVAREVDRRVPTDQERRSEVLVAALLHDVGKTVAGLGTYGRVIATLSGSVGGRDHAELWQDTTGFTRRVGLYLRYPALGAELLEVAGSAPWVVAWAREHHLEEPEWTVPVDVGRLLVAADDC